MLSQRGFLFFIFGFLLYLSGALYNISGVPFRSLLFDPVLLLMLCYVPFLILNSPKVSSQILRLLVLYFIVALMAFFVMVYGSNSIIERVLGYKNFFFYIGSLFIFYFLARDIDVYELYFKYTSIFMFVICAFGIVQSVFGYKLPEAFLAVDGVGLLNFADAPEIVRPTGLIGNSLEFAGFCIISFCYFFTGALWRVGNKLYLLSGAALSVVAVICSLSRAALVILVFSLFIISLLKALRDARLRLIFVSVLFGFVLAPLTLYGFFEDSFLMKRFTEPDVNTVHSNISHVEDYEAAISEISSSPILGVGVGSQGISARNVESKIITDGAWFIIALEFGLAVLFIYFCLLSFVLAGLMRICFRAMPLLSSLSAFLIVSFVSLHVMGLTNSAYLSPVILVTLWGGAGMLFSAVETMHVRRGMN